MISGFYMQFVLTTSYRSVSRFYTSRALRIFVPYYVVLLFVVLLSVLNGAMFGDWLTLQEWIDGYETGGAGVQGRLVAGASVLSLFFQDWVMFLSHEPGAGLEFTANFWSSEEPLWKFLLIPQAWSVGLELCFYLVAPFLASRMRVGGLCLLVAFSLIVRFMSYHFFGLAHDPWTYRFFPFELALFLMGMLSARFYLESRLRIEQSIPSFLTRGINTTRGYLLFVTTIMVAIAFAAQAGHMGMERIKPFGVIWREVWFFVSYLPWLIVVPVLFAVTKKCSIDRDIGELSYPVYLIHFSLILLLTPWVEHGILGETSALASVLLSAALLRYLLLPFERWRARQKSEPTLLTPIAAAN